MELDFGDIRQIEYEILLSVDRLASELDLRYFLDFGTLLGARRHKGFIPWDDDIDIAMAPETISRFLQVGTKLLPKHLITVRHTVFPPAIKVADTRYFIMERSKLELSGTHVTHPAIDIFPFAYYRRFSKYLPTKTTGRIAQKRPTARARARILFKQDLPQALAFSAIAGIPPALLRSYAGMIEVPTGPNWNHERSHLFVCHALERGTGIKNLPYSAVFPLRKLEFEGREFFAPRDTDSYLTSLYGDWRKPIEYPQHVLRGWSA